MFDMVLNALWIQNSCFCEDGVSYFGSESKKERK